MISRHYRRSVFSFLPWASLCLFMTACTSGATTKIDSREKFQVVQPVIIDTLYTKEYVAEIQSVQNVELRSRVKGFIEKIYVDEGMPVKEGQVLFTFSDKAFREELLKAKAQLKSAFAELKVIEVELKNTGLLVDKNIVSKSELEMTNAKKEAVEAKIDEAKSAISLSQLSLSFTEVKAPFAGVINRIPNKTGSLVEEGTLLTTISNNKEMFAYFNVSEKEYLDYLQRKGIEKQNEVSLLLADNRIFNYKGSIETAENEIDKNTGNIAFRARFSNPEQLLKHGATGKVLLNSELKNVLVIPQKSTFEIQDKIYVFVVDKNDMVSMKNIGVGLRLPHLYVVESGLTQGDRIIYEGIQKVKEGDKVIPEQVSIKDLNEELILKTESTIKTKKVV